MAGSQVNGAAGHFGRQLRKERLAHGWSILELARRMSVDPAHLGRVENGKRPPTANLAARCDEAFPERRGWFAEFYDESRDWPEVPATFKSWPEYEDRSASLRDWSPSIVTGLLQTRDYARALIAVQPHITPDTAAARLASRTAWVEHAVGGFVYTEREILSGLTLRFDTLRGECYRVSESVALLERLESTWKAGASPLTQTATAATASRQPATTA